MANAICNLDPHGQIVYPVNEGMSDVVRSTELAWCRLFYDMETMVGNPLHTLFQYFFSYT